MNSNKQAITLEKGQDGAGNCPCAHLHEAARPQLQKWDQVFLGVRVAGCALLQVAVRS